MKASLYIVSTPIGNLNDFSDRAKTVLTAVDLIAAEDTRHSKKLLDHFGITTAMTAYHEHSSEQVTVRLIEKLLAGTAIALISDAGTPLISDPGFRLVQAAHEAGIKVVPIPGACAFVAALSAAGLPSDRFSFEGFLPAKKSAREKVLNETRRLEHTHIFYESPHRVMDCLKSLEAVYGGERFAVMARELTKTFETIRKSSLTDLVGFVDNDLNQQKGEIVLVLEGRPKQETESLPDLCAALADSLKDEMPPKKISKLLARHFDCSSKAVYEYLLTA